MNNETLTSNSTSLGAALQYMERFIPTGHAFFSVTKETRLMRFRSGKTDHQTTYFASVIDDEHAADGKKYSECCMSGSAMEAAKEAVEKYLKWRTSQDALANLIVTALGDAAEAGKLDRMIEDAEALPCPACGAESDEKHNIFCPDSPEAVRLERRNAT